MIYGTICVMHAAISFPASTHAVSLGQSRRRLLALVFAVIATAPPGRSQDPAAAQPRRYESLKGYALKIPEGWTVADESLREEIMRESMALAQPKTESGLKLPEYDVVIRDESSANFFASINVIISKERPPASQKELDKASNAIQEGYRSMGVSIQNFSADIKRVAGRDCFLFTFAQMHGGLELKQSMYIIPGHGVNYMVTCTSLASDWDRYEPIFTSAMESFEVTGAGLGWWKRMPTWARDGAVGAVVGLLVMTVLEIRKRRRARLAPQGTQELSEVDDSRRGDSAERSG